LWGFFYLIKSFAKIESIMATVTRENIGNLHEKLTITVNPSDYQHSLEEGLKKQAKNATIPGFRKGMVPVGILKKMYGEKIIQEEIIKRVDSELGSYLKNEKLDILFNPLPISNNLHTLDVNSSKTYEFTFEIGLKPTINIDPSAVNVTKYVIEVTEKMVDDEANRLQLQFGKLIEQETISTDEDQLNIIFDEIFESGEIIEGGISRETSIYVKNFTPEFRTTLIGTKVNDVIDVDLSSAFNQEELKIVKEELGIIDNEFEKVNLHYKITIDKIGLLEKAPLNEDFYKMVQLGKDITNEEEFRAAIKDNISEYFKTESSNQVHDQIYHALADHTPIELPETYLLKVLESGVEKTKTKEEAVESYPAFASQLKWSLITNYIQKSENLEVYQEDIKQLAKNQLFQYMGNQLQMMGNDARWIDDYVNRMAKDKKFVDDAYHQILTKKIFLSYEPKVNATEESIDFETFKTKLHHHH